MTMISKFAGTCRTCGLKFTAGSVIDWTRGAGASHTTSADCEVARVAEKAKLAAQAAAPKLDVTPIVAFIKDAKTRGLKFPKLRVLDAAGQTELRIGLTTKGLAPGSVSVTSAADGYLGCIRPTGEVVRLDAQVQAQLIAVATDPAKAAKAYASLMCRCSFCGLTLTDAGSVEVVRTVCAKHWGLPWKAQGTRKAAEVAPDFAAREEMLRPKPGVQPRLPMVDGIRVIPDMEETT